MSNSRSVVFLDCETTGLSPAKGERLIELGLVKVMSDESREEWQSYFNPQGKMSNFAAFKIHKIKDVSLQREPLFVDRIDEIKNFIGDSVVVIHNSTFDMKFLSSEFSLCGHDTSFLEDLDVFDSMIFWKNNGVGSVGNSLDKICEHYKLNMSSRSNKHGALIDSRLLCLAVQSIFSDENIAKSASCSFNSFPSSDKPCVNDMVASFAVKGSSLVPSEFKTRSKNVLQR